MKLGKIQQKIMQEAEYALAHGRGLTCRYIDGLLGYSVEEVEAAADRLVARGLLNKKISGYTNIYYHKDFKYE